MKTDCLFVGGCDTVALAQKYGTPLYVIDEGKIRSNMQRFSALLRECFPAGSRVLFASKALSYVDIYRIAASEGVAADVVSPGELYTACKAGFDTADVYFHGNNKTDADIAYALDVGGGHLRSLITRSELLALDRLGSRKGKTRRFCCVCRPASTRTRIRRSSPAQSIPSSAPPLRPGRQCPSPSARWRSKTCC